MIAPPGAGTQVYPHGVGIPIQMVGGSPASNTGGTSTSTSSVGPIFASPPQGIGGPVPAQPLQHQGQWLMVSQFMASNANPQGPPPQPPPSLNTGGSSPMFVQGADGKIYQLSSSPDQPRQQQQQQYYILPQQAGFAHPSPPPAAFATAQPIQYSPQLQPPPQYQYQYAQHQSHHHVHHHHQAHGGGVANSNAGGRAGGNAHRGGRGSSKKQPDHSSTDVDFNTICRHHLEGKCNRRYCRFLHPAVPGSHPSTHASDPGKTPVTPSPFASSAQSDSDPSGVTSSSGDSKARAEPQSRQLPTAVVPEAQISG